MDPIIRHRILTNQSGYSSEDRSSDEEEKGTLEIKMNKEIRKNLQRILKNIRESIKKSKESFPAYDIPNNWRNAIQYEEYLNYCNGTFGNNKKAVKRDVYGDDKQRQDDAEVVDDDIKKEVYNDVHNLSNSINDKLMKSPKNESKVYDSDIESEIEEVMVTVVALVLTVTLVMVLVAKFTDLNICCYL
ncbi:unnamed protein product [Meganyctiphanes norvegica]|uniref:Uncharacterized protein n=1 Tax=Meganyctiphanes norvegica TaxID=48144 RepID=A0AAV2RIC7_MEGNR